MCHPYRVNKKQHCYCEGEWNLNLLGCSSILNAVPGPIPEWRISWVVMCSTELLVIWIFSFYPWTLQNRHFTCLAVSEVWFQIICNSYICLLPRCKDLVVTLTTGSTTWVLKFADDSKMRETADNTSEDRIGRQEDFNRLENRAKRKAFQKV